MHIRLGSRRRAYKASTDGNFDDNVYFDEEPFGSPPTSSSSSFLPVKLQNGPSPVHHVESALSANTTIDTTLDSNLAPSPIKTAKATTSTDSSSPTEKKDRFKIFKRKSKKESSKKKAKSKSKEADDKHKGLVMGMRMLDDDADPESGNVSTYESEAETSFGGDHTTTWEAGHDDDLEAGLQVQLQLTPNASHVRKSDALSDTGTNDDGFFAATFDFRATRSSNIEFPSVADESGFLSFEANDDWNPKSGDFQSFSHGNDGEMEAYSVAKNEQESIQPNRYSTPTPSVTKRNYNDNAHVHESNIDFELEGPIDSDTLEQWDAMDPAAYCYNPTVSQATQGKGENSDTRSGRNTPELTASSNTSSNSMDDDGFGISSPIDVDTLQPWAPTMWSKSGQASESSVSDDEAFRSISSKINKSSHVSASEAKDDFEDMWNDANSCSFDGRDFAETDNLNSAGPGPSHTHVHTPSALPEKAGREAISLTLGMLAQISGLANFDAANTNKYGKSCQDDTLEDEDAEAIAKAASQTQDHDKASPEGIENSTSAGFRCTSHELDTQLQTRSASPFTADVSKIEKNGELSDQNAAALFFNSPFEASVSRIENNSDDEVQLAPTDEFDYGGHSNEISDSFAGPRALEGAFQDFDDAFDTDQAEKEMTHIVSQIKGTWEERAEDLEARLLDVALTDKKKEGRIAEVQKYWNEKQQKLASIHTDSISNIRAREVNVEWPDAPASTPLNSKRPTALEDNFLSRNKNTKEWDVPSSVFTSGNTDASHVTDLSSVCEQSMDLTDDGYPVFKKKTAKEAYRASNNSVHSSNSAKGFFWRSHPEGANVEVTPRTRSKTAEKKRITGPYPPSAQNRPGSSKRSSSANAGEVNSEYINFPDSITRRASRDEEDTKVKPTKASASERIKSMHTQVTSNASVPWGKENLKLRNVDLSRSKSVDNPQNRRDEPIKSSPTMEWRKAIEAKIKSTSDKVRAVRTNATSPTSFTEKKPPAAPSKPNLRRAPSPFQANRNSFLNNRLPTDAFRSGSTQRKSIIIAGVPHTIEKRAVDDDAMSGCSSMADRIKQFETKSQSNDDGKPRDNGKHGTSMFNRTTPLNSYALNKLRNVTSNVGGIWS